MVGGVRARGEGNLFSGGHLRGGDSSADESAVLQLFLGFLLMCIINLRVWFHSREKYSIRLQK